VSAGILDFHRIAASVKQLTLEGEARRGFMQISKLFFLSIVLTLNGIAMTGLFATVYSCGFP